MTRAATTLANPCTGARRRDFLLGLRHGQLVRAHVPSWCSGHGVDAGCSQRAGPPGQLTSRSYQTPAEGTGVDVCYTNHAEADQDDMDTLLTLLGVAGCTYVMGVPGADDVMLSYQSTSFHDALYVRSVLGLRPAPEFEAWLERMGILDAVGRVRPRQAHDGAARLLASAVA